MSDSTNSDSTNRADSEASEHKAKMQALKEEQREKVQSKTIRRGVIVVNTGDGKGKSTAAFGLAFRAVGNGQKVGLIQFIKGKWKTGETQALARFPEIDHVVSGEGFTWETQDHDRDVAAARAGWKTAVSMMRDSEGDRPKYQLIILDELNIALRYEQLPVDEVVEALKNKPNDLNVVVTGRNAPQALIDLADTVTEMTPIKHAFEAGIRAQKGIEF